MFILHHIVNFMTILTVANVMPLSRDLRKHRFREDITIIMVNLAVCWLVVELVLKEHGDVKTARGMAFTLARCGAMTLPLNWHSYILMSRVYVGMTPRQTS